VHAMFAARLVADRRVCGPIPFRLCANSVALGALEASACRSAECCKSCWMGWKALAACRRRGLVPAYTAHTFSDPQEQTHTFNRRCTLSVAAYLLQQMPSTGLTALVTPTVLDALADDLLVR
jgi:hypothetical protein